MIKTITKKTTVREISVNEESDGNRRIAATSEQTEEKTVEIDQESNRSGLGTSIPRTRHGALSRIQDGCCGSHFCRTATRLEIRDARYAIVRTKDSVGKLQTHKDASSIFHFGQHRCLILASIPIHEPTCRDARWRRMTV